ncbi:DUF1365 domain-containing protein [Dongia sp.]|uniref:DUF1365 domain-containing protein n=1 Tax=Dongia sp. TaxID=1977262 RepID=UPI0035B035E1
MWRSGIYCGSVMHRRVRPKRHHLRYSVFYLVLDLDELPDLQFAMLGIERPAPLSFRAKDHGDGSGNLKAWVLRELRAGGVAGDIGRIKLMCFPRVFGFVFNPISVFFCYAASGEIAAILYEVNNTFGARHAYVLPAEAAGDKVFQTCAKRLYVSPFNDVSGGYHFAVRLPGEKVALSIDQHDAGGHLLRAAFAGRRRELTEKALLRLLVVYPLLTLKVVAGIHWEALKLWLKGVPLHKRPGSVDTSRRSDIAAPDMRGDKHGGVFSEPGSA